MLPNYQCSPLFPSDCTSEAYEMKSTCPKETQIFCRFDLPRHWLYKAGYPGYCPTSGSFTQRKEFGP